MRGGERNKENPMSCFPTGGQSVRGCVWLCVYIALICIIFRSTSCTFLYSLQVKYILNGHTDLKDQMRYDLPGPVRVWWEDVFPIGTVCPLSKLYSHERTCRETKRHIKPVYFVLGCNKIQYDKTPQPSTTVIPSFGLTQMSFLCTASTLCK